jgi:hypothetical protein
MKFLKLFQEAEKLPSGHSYDEVVNIMIFGMLSINVSSPDYRLFLFCLTVVSVSDTIRVLKTKV